MGIVAILFIFVFQWIFLRRRKPNELIGISISAVVLAIATNIMSWNANINHLVRPGEIAKKSIVDYLSNCDATALPRADSDIFLMKARELGLYDIPLYDPKISLDKIEKCESANLR